MNCPYNNFYECLVEKCPACIYEKEVITHKHSQGEIYEDEMGEEVFMPYMPGFKFIGDRRRDEVKAKHLKFKEISYYETEEILYHFKLCRFVEHDTNNIQKTIKQRQLEKYGKPLLIRHKKEGN